jgi:hypothetical protein
MDFDEKFKALLSESKHADDTRVLKLEYSIPIKYESSMNEFLEKFFLNDPFDIKPQDLELVVTGTGRIKRLRFDRRPSTYLSLLRFFEFYRQRLKSISSDLNILANFYKDSLANNENDPHIAGIKKQILAEVFSAGRLLKRWTPQLEQFYKKTIKVINDSFSESEATNGKSKGFINLRKVYPEGYLNVTFGPHYESMVNFCIVCIAYSSKLRATTNEYNRKKDSPN